MTAPVVDEAEFDRRRRRSQKFLAFDLLAELHGQAEWQRFSREHPLLFLRAKFDVQGGPPGLWLSVDWRNHEREEVLYLFEWPVIGRLERHACQISFRSLIQDEDGSFLAATARWWAHDVECHSGVETRIVVRGNREAWEWHEDHKHDPPQEAPSPLPRTRRVAGEICGRCDSRFRVEDLPSRGDMLLPCGHPSVAFWTEEDI